MKGPKEINTSEPTQKAKEFLLDTRKYLKTVISLSEKKLNNNKERLKAVEDILGSKFYWVESEETTINQHLTNRTIARRILMDAKHERQKNDEKDWIKEFDKKTIHYVFTVFVSMMTAIIVVLAATGQL